MNIENIVRCKVCGSYISTDTNYIYTPCACGTIAVDGGPDYCRVLGERKNWELVKNENYISNSKGL